MILHHGLSSEIIESIAYAEYVDNEVDEHYMCMLTV